MSIQNFKNRLNKKEVKRNRIRQDIWYKYKENSPALHAVIFNVVNFCDSVPTWIVSNVSSNELDHVHVVVTMARHAKQALT